MARRSSGKRHGWHIEESIEVNAHSNVVHAPQQLRSGSPFQGLMQAMGGGQSIVHRVPVSKLVGRVEMGHAEEGCMSGRRSKLLGSGPEQDAVVDCSNDFPW